MGLYTYNFNYFVQIHRIQLNGENKKGWSGLIPLQKSGKNNAPWLVKVPTNTKHNFISFWVRVMRENVGHTKDTGSGIPQRVLVVIWPLFMIKSMLSIDTSVSFFSNFFYIFSHKNMKLIPYARLQKY